TAERTGDGGELYPDRLMLDDAAAARHAQVRVLQRRLLGRAADSQSDRRRQWRRAPAVAGQRRGALRIDEVLRRHPALLQRDRAPGTMKPPIPPLLPLNP